MKRLAAFVKKNYTYLLLALIICLQVGLAIFWNCRREGFHLDELWSFGLANSNYHPHIFSDGALDKGWINSDYIKDYLVVGEDHRFDYASVIDNQKHDVHPPLFYIVLHTVCSFFPGTFSSWFAVIPNLVFFVLSLIILFKLSKLLLKNDMTSLAVVLFYGFSNAGISTAIYIRMYMLFTLFVLSYMYVHAKMVTKNEQTTGNLVALSIILFAGFMTHYYFIIIAFLISTFYSLWLLVRKQWKVFAEYAIFMLVPLLLVTVLYPTAYTTILGGNATAGINSRGQEAIKQLLSISDLPQKIIDYFYAINNQLFGLKIKQIVVTFILLAVAYAVLKRVKLTVGQSTGEIYVTKNKSHVHAIPKKFVIPRNTIAIVTLLLCTAIYFVLMSIITPEYPNVLGKDQYLYCIYPAITLLFVAAVYKILQFLNAKHIQTALLSIVVIILLIQMVLVDPNHTYLGHVANTQKSLQHGGSSCVFAAPPDQKYALLTNAQELVNCSRIYPLWTDNGIIDDNTVKNSLHEARDDDVLIYIDPSIVDDKHEALKNIASYINDKKEPFLEFVNSGNYEVYSLKQR